MSFDSNLSSLPLLNSVDVDTFSEGDSSASERYCLGIYAESSTTPPASVDNSRRKSEKWDWSAATIERYALQHQARRAMLEAFYRIPQEERPKRAHKVTRCRRWLRPSKKDPKKLVKPVLLKHQSTGNTFLGGHEICANPKACPICCSIISEKRVPEIRHAVDSWYQEGGICLFVTLTAPHYSDDSLIHLVHSLQAALKYFREGRSFTQFKKKIGYKWLIRSFECPWGQANSFHPHLHEIWFCRPNDLQAAYSGYPLEIAVMLLEQDIYQRWAGCAVKAGLSEPSRKHGVVVKVAESQEQLRERLAEYMVKTGLSSDSSGPVWTVADEMVRAHSKRGKPDRFTPFDFLREQYNPENDEETKAMYRRLFVEYIEAFRGVAQVYWSPGLKKYFEVSDISDEQHAAEGDEDASLLLEIAPKIWAFVIGFIDHRGKLLASGKNGGAVGAKQYLSSLLDQYYLEHFQDDFIRMSEDARWLYYASDSSFLSLKDERDSVTT